MRQRRARGGARAKLEELLGHRTAQLDRPRARSAHGARRARAGISATQGLVGTSEAMRKVYALIDRVKDTDVPVLITGESGTGKEIVARAIHNAGPRGKKPFLGINCGAIPEHLLESELFGHVRGAFTGADRDRKGLFREADERHHPARRDRRDAAEDAGGPPARAAGEGRPPGRRRPRRAGRRARHRRDQPRSRGDGRGGRRSARTSSTACTSSRCSVPPLRERLEDIPVLIDHFLGIFAAPLQARSRSVSRAALRRLMALRWPGNVRQLENVLLNAWVLCDVPELYPDDFDLPAPGRRSALPAAEAPEQPTPRQAPPSSRGAPSSRASSSKRGTSSARRRAAKDARGRRKARKSAWSALCARAIGTA